MAIKKLDFNRGEELELRKKAPRIPSNEVLDNMDEMLNDESRLILQCGKSYWDVSAFPEIFAEGEDFDPESLTSIDLKQMSKQEPPKPAFGNVTEGAANDMLTELYHRTDEDEEEEEEELLVRKTYYLRPLDVEALRLLCFHMEEEVSVMVREIFEKGIDFIGLENNLVDLYKEAETNLQNRPARKKRRTKKRTIL